MARFVVPTNGTIHASRSFFSQDDLFVNNGQAVLDLHPSWMHLEPVALAAIAAWGAWCKRQGLQIETHNLNEQAGYAARMRLFEHLEIPYPYERIEHEEAGRFLPIRNVRDRDDVRAVIADISALLHLDRDTEALAAVQYCLSELLRNVLEHSGSPDGAFVCAHNYSEKGPHRVTLAVADCGRGVAAHLGRAHPDALENDARALQLAMSPGVTGAMPGLYGTPDNAGAGLFITRCIAKGTGGYFELISGSAAYRLMRVIGDFGQSSLFTDPFLERCAVWQIPKWQGTIVTMEIRTEMIAEFEGFFGWIRQHIPQRRPLQQRIRFTNGN